MTLPGPLYRLPVGLCLCRVKVLYLWSRWGLVPSTVTFPTIAVRTQELQVCNFIPSAKRQRKHMVQVKVFCDVAIANGTEKELTAEDL